MYWYVCIAFACEFYIIYLYNDCKGQPLLSTRAWMRTWSDFTSQNVPARRVPPFRRGIDRAANPSAGKSQQTAVLPAAPVSSAMAKNHF